MNKRIIKFLGLFSFAFVLTIRLSSNVFAYTNTYYTNSKGVAFTEEQYSNLTRLGFTAEEIDGITQELYDSYGEINDVIVDKTTTKYFRETTVNNSTYVEEISERDYENEIPSLSLVSSRAGSTHETNYKKLTLTSYQVDVTKPTERFVVSDLTWKKLPSVRSFDIYAARVSSNGYIVNGTQFGSMTATATKFNGDCTPIGSQDYTSTYSSGDGAWNTASGTFGYSGIGFTSELKRVPYVCLNDFGMNNASVSAYSARLSFKSYTGTTVYASYQHASTSVSYNSVYRAYSFSNSGLGNVIYFSNSTLTNSYDNMGGVQLSL